ncbi:MAG TPA: tail fiber domain-containing protein, partial [Candidatus Kapabacteria bacterium]|nr:tail fiber domain-containing protein [Candidatus Kapabacteria bacterium]
WIMAENEANHPVAVSPGSETGVVTVWQSCPTFSWSAVDQAASYRVAVFESVDANVANYETMATMVAPVVSKNIPGPALSWTLSADEKLKTGGQYTWYVQALDAAGNALGPWSGGRIFKVEQEVRFAGIAEKLGEVLKSYGVKDETITNVLTDMKTEVQEVAISGIKGFEGPANTFYGQNAGASITTGTYNTFIGASAGYSNTSGCPNDFFGYNAGYSNTTGNYNTFLGYLTGRSSTTASYNVFIGNQTGCNNTTGDSNNFIGYRAGLSNNTGYQNLFLGTCAGYANTSGTYNVFLGNYAGRNTTTAYFNDFIGYYAGYYNTIGYLNVFLGNYAGYANTTGTTNTFIGHSAGYLNTTGSYNTILGNYAGRSNSSGNSNVFVGYNAGYSETGSNKLYIANTDTSFPLLYGDFYSGILAVNGYLGVGRQAPYYPLHMASGAYCSAGGTWTNASSRELKENIQDLSIGEAVETLTRLNPVKYNYKVDKADKHVGFIAEDVPDLVATTDRKGLSPMDITAVLTRVVQELKRENQEQQDLIQEQQKIISGLQERMAKLEKNESIRHH